jgi:2-hydroxychromene-2-carboxylate isomerase
MAAGGIEMWFEFGSNYSYLAVMRIEALAAAHGVPVRWQPFLLGPIFRALGWNDSPFVAQKEKGAYVWKDMARQCAKYGIPWRMPTQFPRLALLPLRVMLVGAGRPWIAEFARRVMLANFALDRDIGAAGVIAEILTALGLPAAELIDAAQGAAVKDALRRQTETARDRGVFGAPTFFVGGEMFWGNDRLEDALAFARAEGAVDA